MCMLQQTTMKKSLFFQMLKEKLKKYIDIQNSYVLIAGDMNCTLDKMDIIAGEAHSEKSVNTFRHFVNNWVLVDTWRVNHPDEKSFTWKKSNPFVARRLDYILVNEVLHSKCVSTDIIVYPRSTEAHRFHFVFPYLWILNFRIFEKKIRVYVKTNPFLYGSPQVPFRFSVFMDFEFSYFREKNPFLREKIRFYVKTKPFLRKNKSVFT